MTLTEIYQLALKERHRVDDPAQRNALIFFETITDELSKPCFGLRLRQRFPALADFCVLSRLFNIDCLGMPVKGAYLWGGVGRGKTWLMHLFYDNLPFQNKQRFHYHAFMQSVHEQLAQTNKQKDPLKYIARNLSRQYRVICLDEFIVTNITDAMLLSGLLKALFRYGVTLIATSNRIPDDLYLNGLQRERFLPAIDLIKANMHVIELDNGVDHRLALLEKSELYYQPLTESVIQLFSEQFSSMASDYSLKETTLTLFKRPIKTLAINNDMIWFDFNIICSSPRAAQDYIEIANQFHTVFLSDVPTMTEDHDDKARRFIYLIDALYDANVKLFINADNSPENLYQGSMLKFAFHRTTSRLIEMRSDTYLKQPHCQQDNPSVS